MVIDITSRRSLDAAAARQFTRFSLAMLAVVLFALYCAVALPKGSVWENHLADGILFMTGRLPATPAYPMWGYSLLAGVLHENVIYLQALLVLLFFCAWYGSCLARRRRMEERGRLLPAAPVLTALVLAPFVFLSVSYFSNALAQLLAFAGTWILYLAVEERRPIWTFALAGALLGLGYHFRTELLLLAGLLAAALVVSVLRRRRSAAAVAAFAVAFTAMLIPWLAYTGSTLQQARLSTTNSGGSTYQGLGQLPSNPWGVEYSDDFVEAIAKAKGLGSPWSEASARYFTQRYFEAIRSHPTAFAKRVLVGWRYMLSQGVYLPKFRLFGADDKRDAELLLYLDETLRSRLGLNAHDDQLAKLRAKGISDGSLTLRHYAILGTEYAARIFYAAAFVGMLGLAATLSLRSRFRDFAAMVFLAYLVFLLFGAGFLQTNPRHTTLIVPACVMAACLLTFRSAPKQSGGGAARLRTERAAAS
jgi:hypothetical protein